MYVKKVRKRIKKLAPEITRRAVTTAMDESTNISNLAVRTIDENEGMTTTEKIPPSVVPGLSTDRASTRI
jgi:hypothetical protein